MPTFDAASEVSGLAVSGLSVSHTCSGSNRGLLVEAFQSATAAGTVTACTYNSVAARELLSELNPTSFRGTLLFLVAPATGANTLSVTYSKSEDEVAMGGTSYTNVRQTDSVGPAVGANGLSSAPTVTIPSATGEVVVAGVYHFQSPPGSLTPGAGQTERWEIEEIVAGLDAGASEEAGAASVTMSYTGSADFWLILGVSLRDASASARWPLQDAVSSVSGTSVSGLSVAHVCSGGKRLLLAGAGQSSGVPGTATGATYNSVAMTSVATVVNSFCRGTLFRLISPASGSNTLAVTFSQTEDEAVLGGVSKTSVDQTTPLGTAATASGFGTVPSIAVTSAVDRVVIDFVYDVENPGSPAFTPHGSQTERWEVENIGGAVDGGMSDKPGNTSVTMTRIFSGHPWVGVGVGITFDAVPADSSPSLFVLAGD